MAVEDDLRAERRVPGHLDRHVSPLRVHDVERVVVHVRRASSPGCRSPRSRTGAPATPSPVPSRPGSGTPRLATVVGRPGSPRRSGACVHPLLQSITGTPFAAPHALTRRANRPAIRIRWLSSSCSSLSLCQPPPPHPEPARAVPHRVVGVEHDPVHTVIRAGQQIPVPLAEVIGHPPTVGRPTHRDQSCPEGATRSGRSPGTGVVTLGR